MEQVDALGNPVEIGKKYGYSSTANGFGTVVVGTVKGIGEKMVTIKIESRRVFLYGKQTEPWKKDAPTANIYSFHLFPVA